VTIMGSLRQDQNIVVQIARNFNAVDASADKIVKLVKEICIRCDLAAATVSIAIVDEAQIHKLNKEFLDHDRPTDCLSFDLSENEQKGSKSIEVIVNGEMAVREAEARGHSAEAELALYITHGLLHNLGYDDSDVEAAKKMHEVEDEILKQQGFGAVYNKGGE